MGYSALNTIKTVAAREIAVATRNKAILISLALTLVVIVAGVFLAAWLTQRDADDPELVVSGVDEEIFTSVNAAAAESPGFASMGPGITPLEISAAATPADARDAVADGADAALVSTASGFDLISDGEPNAGLIGSVNMALGQFAEREALNNVGVPPSEYYAAHPDVSLNLVNIGEQTDIAAVVTVLFGVAILIFFIMLFAGNIGGRVTEEKSSRVVEIILSSARPLDFLAGKLLGNLVVGLVGTTVILGAATLALWGSGLLTEVNLDLTVVPILVLAFILGLLFFGSLWAAAGAMVSRSEDLSSTQTPIMILVLGVIYAPAFGWSALQSTVMQVLTWLPPFSLSVAPLQAAAGNLSWPMVIVSYVVMTAATFLVLLLVARIYRNAVLYNGSKMKWTQALRSST